MTKTEIKIFLNTSMRSVLKTNLLYFGEQKVMKQSHLFSACLEKAVPVQGSGTTFPTARKRRRWWGRKALAPPRNEFWVSSEQFPLSKWELPLVEPPQPLPLVQEEPWGIFPTRPRKRHIPLQAPSIPVPLALKAIQAFERNGSINYTGDTLKPFLWDHKYFK